jgi:hypothetical protein
MAVTAVVSSLNWDQRPQMRTLLPLLVDVAWSCVLFV